VLASTSVYREKLLQQTGLDFQKASPLYQEEHGLELSPSETVVYLSKKKAESLVPSFPGSIIIGSDQVMDLDGEIIGKPADLAESRHRLRQLSGRYHTFFTGLSVIWSDDQGQIRRQINTYDSTKITFKPLSDQKIEHYLEQGESLDCAGSYKIEGRGIWLVEKIEGDYHTIIGLPLIKLLNILEEQEGDWQHP